MCLKVETTDQPIFAEHAQKNGATARSVAIFGHLGGRPGFIKVAEGSTAYHRARSAPDSGAVRARSAPHVRA